MALTAKQLEVFEENQRLRDEVFKLVQFEINDIFDYLRIVDDYDHCGTPDEFLAKETAHLKQVFENLTKGNTNAS